MTLNRILDQRQAVRDAREAQRIKRSPRPLPRYPDRMQSLKLHRAA